MRSPAFPVSLLSFVVAASPLGCSRDQAAVDAGAEASAAPLSVLTTIARAEDQRRAKDVTEAMTSSHDVTVRRRAARALARIADETSIPGLMRALSDEDPQAIAWGAYGLGAACKGKEDAHVSALVARSVSFDAAKDGPESNVDPRTAIARAIGRCGGAGAEQILTAWVRARGPWSERAAYALGDLGSRHGGVGSEAMTALLDASLPAGGAAPLPSALYPFGRMPRVSEEFSPRVIEAARASLAIPGTTRIFAVRALSRSGPLAASALVGVVKTATFTVAERAEAARALGQIDDPGSKSKTSAGRAAAAEALNLLVPDKDPFALMRLGGDDFGILAMLVGAMGTEPPASAEPALYALAALMAPGAVPVTLARRLGALRCGAASALAKGAYETELLSKCDSPATENFERARLSALIRRPLTGERKKAWILLTKSTHIRVQEAALEAIGAHPELAEVGRAALIDALTSKKAGYVATAAEVIKEHPERAYMLAEKERRAALDPSSPPPTGAAAHEVDPAIVRALTQAIDTKWNDDLVETRFALIQAALALDLKNARALATTACHDPNVTMRQHAQKSLAPFSATTPVCSAPETALDPAPEIAAPLARSVKLSFVTDAGALGIRFDPDLAPIASTRFVALAKAGFYKGIVFHRVVPGFVVQFGDPDGDGYGGAGRLLRCETSPVPFEPLDVGVALAGRDTGSSQIFVTLSRTPHLDGEYARVGHAEGDWAAVAEGDVIQDVKVEEEK
ncbi:MAG: peptidylprolyl isomerase [Polyangiaceae bacterium]